MAALRAAGLLLAAAVFAGADGVFLVVVLACAFDATGRVAFAGDDFAAGFPRAVVTGSALGNATRLAARLFSRMNAVTAG